MAFDLIQVMELLDKLFVFLINMLKMGVSLVIDLLKKLSEQYVTILLIVLAIVLGYFIGKAKWTLKVRNMMILISVLIFIIFMFVKIFVEGGLK